MSKFIYTMKGLGKIYPPDSVVFQDIWLSFLYGAKIGVIGANGSGKSTLLKIMAGLDPDFAGEATLSAGYTVGYLPQEPQLDAVEDRARQRRGGRRADSRAAHALRRNQREVRRGDCRPRRWTRSSRSRRKVQDAIEAAGAWDLDSKLEHAMDALRLPPADADVTKLSGGERRRVALCRLLLQSPDLLLLDEPTNHLDAESVAWLEHFLHEYKGIGRRDHARPLLPRQRRRLDPRARSHQGLSRGKATTRRWLDQKQQRLALEEKSGDRSGSGRCSASSSGSACRRARGRRRARRASTPTNNCSPRTRPRRSIASRSTFRPGRGSATSSSKRATCARATATCCSSTTSTSRCRAAASSA